MFGAELILSQMLNLSIHMVQLSDRDTILSRHQHLEAPLDETFDLLVWNILKGHAKQRWFWDFQTLNRDVDLSLLQEGLLDGFIDLSLKAQTHQNWSFSTSFKTRAGETGVATGTSSKVQGFITHVSPVTEPVSNTPKVTQIKFIPLTNGSRLLTLNIHAINFVSQASFEKHINSLLPAIRSHQGPILWAGDFNTWNQRRMRFLDRALGKYELKRVLLEGDYRMLKLDHIYLRGCEANWARVESHINTSDHYPIRANIFCRN